MYTIASMNHNKTKKNVATKADSVKLKGNMTKCRVQNQTQHKKHEEQDDGRNIYCFMRLCCF